MSDDTMTIRVEVSPGSVYTSWPCAICGGRTWKTDVPASFRDIDGDQHFICEDCIEAGAEAFPERLEAAAQEAEDRATFLRHAAKSFRWDLPTPDALSTAQSDSRVRMGLE